MTGVQTCALPISDVVMAMVMAVVSGAVEPTMVHWPRADRKAAVDDMATPPAMLPECRGVADGGQRDGRGAARRACGNSPDAELDRGASHRQNRLEACSGVDVSRRGRGKN